MRDFVQLHEFMANRGPPETSEELIAAGRMRIISVSGETLSPKSIVHRLHEGDCIRVAGLAGHSEFVVNRSDLESSPSLIKPDRPHNPHLHPSFTTDMDSDKIVDSIKFLLNSVSKLSDRFLESNESTRRSFNHVRQDVDELLERLGRLESDLVDWRDQQLKAADHSTSRQPELPVKPGQEKIVIPALNLPLNGILETYRTSPSLLQPFARACSVSGRTLSGMISEVELEVFAQGTTWIIETQDGEWLLFPRPGLVNRRSQIQSLERLFEIEAEAEPPAVLELLEPGRVNVVEYGRRWYLGAKGRLGLQTDPLQVSLENRLRQLESRLKAIEDAKG